MIPEIDIVDVWCFETHVGRLTMSLDRRCVFEYSPEWLRSGFSISPFYLPLESRAFTARYEPFDGLFGVFNDSLPDGWGNLLIDRWLRENGDNPGEISWTERLSIVGKSGMGALCYEPVIKHKKYNAIKSLDYYASEVEKILNEDQVESLELLVDKAGSPGGARPKVLLEFEGKEWLIKFRAQNDPKNIGEIEYRYSEAARKSGIQIPETRLFDDTYFGIERFDRYKGERIHMITASGLLHASYRYPSLDYVDLMKATFQLTRSQPEVLRLFRLMVFNVLTHNRDDHAKNFSFLNKNNEWVLSPAYDLIVSYGFNGQHSTTINGKGKPEKSDIFVAASLAGLPDKKCVEIYEEVVEGVAGIEFPPVI